MNTPDISVIIPTYRSLDFLKRTIACLEVQLPDLSSFEVIVVDDGSNDGTEKWLSSYNGSLILKYVAFEYNKGRSTARNAGVKISTGSLLLFLDGDMEFEKDFVFKHAKSHANDLQVIIGSIAYDRISSCRGYAKYLIRRGVMKINQGEQIPGRLFLSGNSSLSRKLFDSVGGFDESLKTYGEDIDFGIRLATHGAYIEFNPELTVQHLHIRPLESLFMVSYEYGNKTIPELVMRHPELKGDLRIDWIEKQGLIGIFRRFILSKPFFLAAKAIVRVLNEYRAPAFLYSYLIFRIYYYGYLEHKKQETHK